MVSPKPNLTPQEPGKQDAEPLGPIYEREVDDNEVSPTRGETVWKLRNPTHGGWVDYSDPTYERDAFEISESHPRSWRMVQIRPPNRETSAFKVISMSHSANVDEQVGSEPSTNFWGGISECSHRLGSGGFAHEQARGAKADLSALLLLNLRSNR